MILARLEIADGKDEGAVDLQAVADFALRAFSRQRAKDRIRGDGDGDGLYRGRPDRRAGSTGGRTRCRSKRRAAWWTVRRTVMRKLCAAFPVEVFRMLEEADVVDADDLGHVAEQGSGELDVEEVGPTPSPPL